MVRQRTFILALAAALLMLLMVGSVAFADGPTTTTTTEVAKGEVCVDGYVINHRELPVDGTKTTPPLVVEAVDANGNVVARDEVDANGYFKFEYLSAGFYNFRLQLPPGWEGIVPEVSIGGLAETGLTEFAKNEKCYRILFKIRRITEVPVIKWEEALDGTVVLGEDWVITATPVKDPFAKVQTVTTKNGEAVLKLTPGKWTIAETVKAGWVPVTPSVVTRVVDQYAPYADAAQIPPIVFKNRKPVCHATIVVTKYGYGTNPSGERETLGPLSGWKVTVSRADGTWPAVVKKTSGDGQAVFDKLYPGVYKVTEEVQAGWKVLGDNPVTVVLMDCETANVKFDNMELIGQFTISGKKLFKAWEKPYKGTLVGISGWEITASLVGTDREVSTTTNALGEYTFTEEMLRNAGMAFPGASIKVCEEDRDNWIHVTPKCVTIKFPYPMPATYKGATVNFINVQDPPVAGATYAEPAAAGGACRAYHTVASGDTLAKVAGKYGASAMGIVRANGIKNPDVIYLGQKLCIP